MGREGRCRQVSLACVGSARGVSATLGLPPLPSTLLRLQVALQGAGPGLRALPRSKPLRSRFSGTPQRGRLGWACALCLPGSEQLRRPGAWPAHSPRVGGASCHLPGPSRAVSGAPCVRADLWLRPSRRVSAVLNLRKSLVRNWKPVLSFLRDALSGAQFALFWLQLVPLAPCLQRGMDRSASGSHFSGIRSSFVLPAGRAFRGIVLALFLSVSLAVARFRLLSHGSSLRLPSGHSGPGPYPKDAACSSPSPRLLGPIWGTTLLGVASRHVICGFYLFIFPPGLLPSEIRKLPPDPPVRGFPGVWKLLY